MEALRNLKYIKDNRANFVEWNQQQKTKEAKVSVLINQKNFDEDEIEKASQYGHTLINTINIMDQLSINRSENALVSINTAMSLLTELVSGIGAGIGFFVSKFSKNPNKTPKIAAYIGYIISSLACLIIREFLSAHFEKMATRIARYQTREKDLKDIRNFVVYNKEQVEQAKLIAENLDDVKDITEDLSFKESLNPIKVFKNSLITVKDLNFDFKNYKNWLKNYKQEEKLKQEKFAQMKISDEEKSCAEKERDKLLNVVKHLEISANNYEINAELGIRIAAAGISFASVTSGFLFSWLFSNLSKNIKKSTKLANFLNNISKFSIPAGFFALFFLTGPLVKIVKDSARIGRQKEKDKFIETPTNFITFSDTEINSVKNIKIKNTNDDILMKNILINFKNIWNMKNEISNYEKTKKEKVQKELKLQEALKHIKISKEQEKEAKKLQKQAFIVFEKIDDKSESFVDDTNAALSSASAIINGTACTIANLLTLKIFGNKISKLTKNHKMPGFWEGIKLTKHLKLKDIMLIFVAPFLATRLLICVVSTICAEIKKYACQIGIMSAMKDLENPKNFIT